MLEFLNCVFLVKGVYAAIRHVGILILLKFRRFIQKEISIIVCSINFIVPERHDV